MRVLVCGGREYTDNVWTFSILDGVHARNTITEIVHGGADGADALGADWARHHEIVAIRVPAKWRSEGRSAGPKRNERMLTDYRPDGVVAFPGGRGTEEMVSRARKAGIPVMIATPPHLAEEPTKG